MEGTDRKFDNLLSSLKTGKWNLYILLVTALWDMQLVPFVFSGAFTVPQVPHTCIAAEPRATPHPDATIITTTTTTTTTITTPDFTNFVNYTSFLANETLDEGCSLPGEPSWTCNSWAFNNSVYGRTLTSEFELVCDRSFLRGVYNSIYYFGALAGSLIGGWLSDRFGRKRLFVINSVFIAAMGCIMPWIPNLTAILILRFLCGLLRPGCGQSSYTLVMEAFEERWRSTAGIIVYLPWCIGMMIFGGMSSLVRDWRWQTFYLALPMILCLPMIWLLDESPRWLIVQGRHEEAYKVLQKAARWNNTTLPPAKDVRPLMEDIRQESADSNLTSRVGKLQMMWQLLDCFARLFRTRKIRRITLAIFCLFFITSMSYIGLSLGGDLFGSDPFVYMVVSGVMEVPGSVFIIPVVERFGRRRFNVVSYALTAAALLGLSVTPSSLGWLVTTLALFGKLTLTAAYQTVFLHASELFPTEVRTWGVGNSNVMALVGSIFGSYLVSTIPSSWSAVPSIVLGGACLLAAAVTLLLPETRGAPLYDTVAALEAARPSRSDDTGAQLEGLLQEKEKPQLTTNSTVTGYTTTSADP